jgi:hypothetical protein
MRGLLIVLMSLTLAAIGFAQSRHGSGDGSGSRGGARSSAGGVAGGALFEAALPVSASAEDS